MEIVNFHENEMELEVVVDIVEDKNYKEELDFIDDNQDKIPVQNWDSVEGIEKKIIKEN